MKNCTKSYSLSRLFFSIAFRRIIRLFGLSLCISCISFGQDSTQAYKEWITAGFGFGAPFENSGFEKISYGLSYNFGWNTTFYQIGLDGVNQPITGNGTYKEGSANVGIGIRNLSEWTHVSAFAGPAIVRVENPDGGTSIVAGVTLNARGFLKLMSDAGLGIDVYGNINSIQSVFAIRFALQLSNAR